MPGAFAITSATNTVRLGENRRGEVAFTVSNVTGRSLRARASIVALNSTEKGWLGVVGDAERSFLVNETHQYAVQIAVPPGATAGSYPFRLDVVAEDNPDVDYTAGPVVAVDVPPSDVVIPAKPKGYVVTLIGAVLGGLVAGLVGGILGFVVAGAIVSPRAAAPADGLGEAIAAALGEALALGLAFVILTMLGLLIGYWLGATIGCWLALRLRQYAGAGKTALVHAAVFPLWTILALVILSPLSDRVGGLILVAMVLLVAVVPPLAARAAVVRLATGSF